MRKDMILAYLLKFILELTDTFQWSPDFKDSFIFYLNFIFVSK